MARRLIDISVPLQNDVPADPPGNGPSITYIDHQQGLPRMLQFFDGPAQTLVDLAASVAGVSATPTRIAIRAVPTIDTPIGRIAYPTPITIVSRTVGGSSSPP